MSFLPGPRASPAARAVRDRLTALSIRATIGTGTDGFVRVLVFADEYDRARDAV